MKNRKKTIKKILLTLAALLLAVVLSVCGILFVYVPSYLSSKEAFDISKVDNMGKINVMSCNVRCFSPTDFGKKSWFYRAPLVLANIRDNAPDIIGFQEVMPLHYDYLTENLIGYDNIITYRDESLLSEGCPVFFRSDKYTLKDKGSFWLSETPEKMSRDWDSACYRICSYVILTDIASGRDFVVFNTHLDHVSDEARVKGIGVVLDKIKQFGGLPSILMGDLNAAENSVTYKSATENFLDVKYQTEDTMTSCTFQAWGQALDRPCIDYIMISKTGFKVDKYAVITKTYDGVYPSDHFPIFAELELI